MSNDPVLDIPYLEPNTAQPEVPVNDMLTLLAAKIAARVLVGIGSGNSVTLIRSVQNSGSMFVLTPTSPGPGGACTMNFAAYPMGLFTVENQTGFVATIKITGQLGPLPTLAHNTLGLFINDGIRITKLL